MLLCAKPLYILDSYGAQSQWNDNELKTPIVTRWRFEGQNWPVGYRMSTAGLIRSHFCDYEPYILLVANWSDCSLDILNVCMSKMYIKRFFSKAIGNFCEEFENMSHRANIGAKCQMWCLSLIWRHISPCSCWGYCDVVHWLIEK